jgi:2-dehydro-3-deoxygluconokinase
VELVTRPLSGLVAIGECMLELSADPRGGWRLGMGGDTFNTALYFARLGGKSAFMTALGTDPFSDELRQSWAAEGLDLQLVLSDGRHLPGLYAIRTDEGGERTFHYWRSQSAARNFFAQEGCRTALDRAAKAELLYLSGITLSLYEAAEREQLVSLAAEVKRRGGGVAFDPNYRPAGWSSAEEARTWFERIAPHVTIALPTFEDERVLWNDPSPEHSWHRWRRHAAEVAVKLGADGAMIGSDRPTHIPVLKQVAQVDTTAAGDSFNAAYLHARSRGSDDREAALEGHRLAGLVIGHRGAIIPASAMSDLLARC